MEFHFALEHWSAILVALGVVGTPAVATMPADFPRTLNDWWHWFHDYAHQLTNSRNDRLATQPIPQPPNPPAVAPKQ